MKKLIMTILISLFFISTGYAAESYVASIKSAGTFQVLSLAWTTDASGNFVARTTPAINGYIVAIITNPGSAAPTADYDPLLTNSDGIDVSGGTLADRHTSTSQFIMPLHNSEVVKMPVLGSLTFDITNAGASKNGVLDIYYTR
jgi:hypothetical protein